MYFFFGVFLGAATSIIKVITLKRTVDKSLDMENKKSKGYVGLQQLLRFVLSAAVLIIGALVPHISLWGVAVGILAFHPSIYMANYKMKKSKEGD